MIEAVTKIKDDFPFLLDIVGIDYQELKETNDTRFALVYIFRSKDFKKVTILRKNIEDPKVGVESISSLYESANWAEREAYDQYGINFKGHPNLKRILNHEEFEGHPLRRDYEITKGQYCTETQDLMDELKPILDSKNLDMENDNLMVLNMGPSHPATHGTIRTIVALDNERIKAAVTEIGYLHRGFEKSCENHNYNQIIPYTDRLNYCSAIMNNIAFSKTVEEMLGLTLPDRGIFIRVILGELSRIIDHIVCLAALLVDMGAQTNYWYMFNARGTAYDFLSKVTGARLTNSYTRIGGHTHDFYDGWEDDLSNVLKEITWGVDTTLAMVERNRIFQERVEDISPISAEDAISFGFTGPCLRASGVPYDMRFSEPYYYYDQFDFDMVVGSRGDNFDRMMVRFYEIKESMKIIKQAVKNIPGGAISVPDKNVMLPSKADVYGSIEGVMNQFKLVMEGVKVPHQEYYGTYEAANGELGYYIVSDGSGTPYRVKVRPPSFYHMSAYPKLITEAQVGDSILTLGTLNIIAGELDR